ncbi:MAG: lysozyme inhibitor LprI family protein [Xanthobacteraceae bacterium]
MKRAGLTRAFLFWEAVSSTCVSELAMQHGRTVRIIIATSILAVPSLAHAADDARYSAEYQTCAKGSTVDIEQCVGQLTKAWDQRLNAAYQKIIKGNRNAYKMRIAQRLWVQFRNANCRYYGAGEGTIRRLEFAECMRSSTAYRALELEDILKGPGG